MPKESEQDVVLLRAVFPIIEEIVTRHYEETAQFIDRDSIAMRLLEYPAIKRKIADRLPVTKPNRQQLLEKAGNCVDWLNACITSGAKISERWNNDFYSRDRLPRKNPTNGSNGRIYWLAPFSNDAELIKDVNAVKQDRTVSATQRKRLIDSRLGQGTFRGDLLKYWKGRCPLSGCSCSKLLRASHIKPWCLSSNQERLSHFNGLLLSAGLDAAFDADLVSFAVDGQILIAPTLSTSDQAAIGIRQDMRLRLEPNHQLFMQFHRERFAAKHKK